MALDLRDVLHLAARARRGSWRLPPGPPMPAGPDGPGRSARAVPFMPGPLQARPRGLHASIDAAAFPIPDRQAADAELLAWLPPESWLPWPDMSGRSVAIVANRPLRDLGKAIDAHDDVLRMNRLPYWAHDPVHDGERMTIWAGLARGHLLPRFRERFHRVAHYPSCFPEIAGQLRAIWCTSPFHVSARFLNFMLRQGLMDRLIVSGEAAYYEPTLRAALPDALYGMLYRRPEREDGKEPRPYFDDMLTGVRTVLLCLLAGAREVGVVGFDFYASGHKTPWKGHDLDGDKRVLEAVEAFAVSQGRVIRYY